MRSDTTGYVEAELPQRGILRLVLQLGLECSRLLQIEAPARQSRPDEHTSRDHLVLRQRAAPRSPLLDLQDAWQLHGGPLAVVWRLVWHGRPVSCFWPG